MLLDATDSSRVEEFTRRQLYRDQSCVMVMPALGDTITLRVHDAMMNMQRLPNQKFTNFAVANMEVSAAYDWAVSTILTHPQFDGWKWMLCVEQDNLPPFDGFVNLITAATEQDYDILGGLYWTKGIGGVPQIWGDITDPAENYRPCAPDLEGGIVDCWGTGMGFTLFRLDLFRDMPAPWFTVQPEDGMFTQDLKFASRLHKWRAETGLPPAKIGVHCGVKVGHVDLATGDVW